MMHRNISVIMLIMASLFAKAQNFNTITRVVYEQQRISGYNSLNKLSAQVDCKDMVWQVLPDNSIKIWDDIHSFTVFSTTLTVPAFAALGDSLRAWQVSCGQSSTPFPTNLDTTHIDTSLIVPTLIENFSIRNNDTLSAILLALNNLTPNDTSNYWILDSIYQELKAVDTLCFTGEIAVSDSLLRTTVVDCGGTNAIAVKMCEGDTTNQFILKDIYKKIDTTINATIREMRDSIARQNIILLNQSTPTIMAATPSYTSNRTLFTANTTPAAYSVGVPANTREITIQNITGADIQITTSQGTQILGTMNNITLSNPNNTTINHAVFTGNITISFFSSVLGDISGVAPRVIIDFKTY